MMVGRFVMLRPWHRACSPARCFGVSWPLSAPELFDAYLVASPSVWWNDEQLSRMTQEFDSKRDREKETVYMVLPLIGWVVVT